MQPNIRNVAIIAHVDHGKTTFSKNASVQYKGCKINIIDTPGHADFGGEVERIMTMANGVLLLVDAKDGPMPQTKFVLKKALEKSHKVIVIINKIDVPQARVEWVLDQTFGLFVDLGATDEQADFPVLYASAIQGKAGTEPALDKMESVAPLFDAIIEYIPAPHIGEGPMQMLVVNVAYDSYKGQIAIGPLVSGSLKKRSEERRVGKEGRSRG